MTWPRDGGRNGATPCGDDPGLKKGPGNMVKIPSGAQQESSASKSLLTNENLSSTPGTHVTVEGETSLLKAVLGSCVQWENTPFIPVLRTLRQEDQEFKACLGNIVDPVSEAGEMAWPSRILTAPVENLDSVSSTHARQLTNTRNSSSRGSSALFWPPQAPSHTECTPT